MTMRGVKTLLKTKGAELYERNRMRLWAAVRESVASGDDVRCLRQLLPPGIDVSERLVRECREELADADFIRESVEKHRDLIGKGWAEKLSGGPTSAILFCFVAARLAKPEIVVETGCATGWTNTLLLFALSRSDKGHLYSIDIPPKAGQHSMDWTLPDGLAPGFLVPESLRSRWTLMLGDVRDHLGPLLGRHRPIDLFFHDSDHTYAHMMWEYTTVWPHLSEGALLVSDDISWNTAFRDFVAGVGRRFVIHGSNLNVGALAK